jgi:hypothetical protein
LQDALLQAAVSIARLIAPLLAEERTKDREEYKTLWRDTQRQINEVSTRLLLGEA